jgi:hypothetical protein
VRPQCAFVVDDTTQARAGRKGQGTSCYFDHTDPTMGADEGRQDGR